MSKTRSRRSASPPEPSETSFRRGKVFGGTFLFTFAASIVWFTRKELQRVTQLTALAALATSGVRTTDEARWFGGARKNVLRPPVSLEAPVAALVPRSWRSMGLHAGQ